MAMRKQPSKHDEIKTEVIEICGGLGYNATPEYRGNGWRADILAIKDADKFAFEIQLSPQSLSKTLERQTKYKRDGIIGCWLFEKPPSKLSDERPDLPLFYVGKLSDAAFSVSLSGRREISLRDFLEEFLRGRIRFCNVARTKPEQHVRLVFYEMECWKCKAMNHIYYVDVTFHSACNAILHPEETLWGSDKNEYRPEIVRLAREFVNADQGGHLKLGDIKKRFSRTVQDSYTSFGCYKCDSIFGDWYVMEAQMEAAYGYGQVATMESVLHLDENFQLSIPHWCYPGELPFCDPSQ